MAEEKEELGLVAAEAYDRAEEWVNRQLAAVKPCPRHKKSKAPRFGCPGCIAQRDAGDALREEALDLLIPDNLREILGLPFDT